MFDGNSNASLISPDNLVGTASQALATGEIQPATKQRPEVETTRKNDFASLNLDFQSDQVDNLWGLACSELALMESTSLGDSATPLFEAQLTDNPHPGDDYSDDQTNRQCAGPSRAKETSQSPYRPNPDEPGEYDPSTSILMNHDEQSIFEGETDDPGRREGRHQSSILPPFKPNPKDKYRKPRRDELLSYLWTAPDYYRTGVHRSSGRVVFYDDGQQSIYSGHFELSKKRFNDGFFRSRPDLVPET